MDRLKISVRNIQIVEYNPKWSDMFEAEAIKIRSALGEICKNVLHIGSTAVPGLAAKPIIDIIAVVSDLCELSDSLEAIGYRYKGEYNLPLRRMYGKKAETEIYLHVHEEASPEIELNIMFRDYLRNNEEARNEYDALKKLLAADISNSQLTSTGITVYNLRKNTFIQNILEKSGFDGLCPRLCTHDVEWVSYKEMRQKSAGFRELKDINTVDQNQKHLVLYKGIKIVAAAEVEFNHPNAFLKWAEFNEDKQNLIYLVKFIEKWVKKRLI